MNTFACHEQNHSNNGLYLYKIERRSSKCPPACADAGARSLRAARANRVFRADEKRIRTENTVLVKNKDGVGLLLYKIADWARMGFHPCPIGDPRGRLFVRAKKRNSATSADAQSLPHAAPSAEMRKLSASNPGAPRINRA